VTVTLLLSVLAAVWFVDAAMCLVQAAWACVAVQTGLGVVTLVVLQRHRRGRRRRPVGG
jgi:uncharacterized membrane protein